MSNHLSDPVMHFVYRCLAHERRRRHDPIGGVNVRLVMAFVKEINVVKYSQRFTIRWRTQDFPVRGGTTLNFSKNSKLENVCYRSLPDLSM